MGMAETAAWFACSGVLERHPGLKVVLTECFAGWLAWVMEFYDRHYFGRLGNELLIEQGFSPIKGTQAPPSYYIKRQISCTFSDDPMALRNRDVTGLDSLMWGNDYPHWEGIFPDSRAWIEKQFVDIPGAEVQQMVHDNAASVFGLTV
jgi:predicted TIM-barrel fold metal-dependent hydrolase